MSKLQELEELIMASWNIIEDLNATRRLLANPASTQDQVDNVLLGLTELYNLRFNELFATYEQLVFANFKKESL